MLTIVLLGVVATAVVRRWAKKRQDATGRTFPGRLGRARADRGRSRGGLFRPRPAARFRRAGAEALQPAGRGEHHAGAGGAVARALHLHRRLHLRDRARRDPGGFQGADRGRRRARAEAQPDHAGNRPAPGAARHRSADDQPVSQPDQELLARGRDRLPGYRLDRRYHPQPERPGDRGDLALHGVLSDAQPAHVLLHELVQTSAIALVER